MKQEPKNESGGRGRGRKETLADKLLDFENLPGGGGVLPYMGYIGTCRGIGYGF